MIAANEEERRKMLDDLAVRGETWVDENGMRIEPGFSSPEHEKLVRHYERIKTFAAPIIHQG